MNMFYFARWRYITDAPPPVPPALPPSPSFTAGLSGALGAFNVQLDEFNYPLLRGGGGTEGWGELDGWTDGEMDDGKGAMGGKKKTHFPTPSPSLSPSNGRRNKPRTCSEWRR